jgi:cytochrome o ubiquinol oxidase subunit 2
MGKRSPKLTIAKVILLGLYVVAVGMAIAFVLSHNNVAVLNPQGTIADQQVTLMVISVLLMLVVVVPVFILTFWIAWKYRAGNTKAKHSPNWDGNHALEAIWWGFPCVIIAILAVFTFISSHQLDPFKPLVSDKPAINIQVVALQWKWLFIYPDYDVASVNEVRFPEKTPVNFHITSDAPMNSFWIPSLGGQIYAMSGMSTKLHLMADKVGVYKGASANISGEGFAGMKFDALSVEETDFKNWVQSTKRSSILLDVNEYNKLASPSKDNPKSTYALADRGLYDKIIMKYMAPEGQTHHSQYEAGH